MCKKTITENEKNDFVNRATDLLGHLSFENFDDRYKWLSQRREILAELGQIQDERHLKNIAREIERHEPTEEDAIKVIREFRRNECPPMVAFIQKELGTFIENLQYTDPDVTDLDIRHAVEYLNDEYQNSVEFLPQSAIRRLIRAKLFNLDHNGDTKKDDGDVPF